MSSQAADVVRELIKQWNQHDSKAAVRVLAERLEYWDVTQPKPFQQRSEVETFFNSFFTAFPNLSFDILNIFASGDKVACEWRMRGTQEKEIDGISAIGKSIDLRGVSVCQIQEGKIVRQVDYWDSGTMMRQLGVSN